MQVLPQWNRWRAKWRSGTSIAGSWHLRGTPDDLQRVLYFYAMLMPRTRLDQRVPAKHQVHADLSPSTPGCLPRLHHLLLFVNVPSIFHWWRFGAELADRAEYTATKHSFRTHFILLHFHRGCIHSDNDNEALLDKDWRGELGRRRGLRGLKWQHGGSL